MAAMASVWSKTVDPSTGAVYYHNYRTGEAKWEKPLLFGGKDVEDFAGHLEEPSLAAIMLQGAWRKRKG